MDVIERIQQLMKARGIESARQLSDLSGIPQTTLSANFRRQFSPSVATLQLLCDYFGITLAQLFSDPKSEAFYPLSEEQRELIARWENLNPEQQAAILNLLDVMK